MQLLEGDESRVASLDHTIATDPRHSGSMVLLKSHADTRVFAERWMAFRNVNDPSVVQLPGSTNLNDREFFAGTDFGCSFQQEHALKEVGHALLRAG